ncbi:succinyldiaminopimelate transaminase [Reinekea thalattae]|uniref:Succinyldiaminopimelate transaminase n=1 Tax=Reinekea thalattae TaxID=2593301 RepID=A0A5C8ZB20_9GAMM|nr:succinyldiaminopimelate transaminase [Reinekea thalattae]TXR54086.1 succinyldiaminopimelate transaminase [Reinekea thalattae]
MNPNLDKLHPYPFEKLHQLTANITPADLPPVFWGVGEPKHQPPAFFKESMINALPGYSNYPATKGITELREAIVDWAKRRFQLSEDTQFDADNNVLPVNGTREALFAIVQALFDSSSAANEIWSPNPFYQIYEGATLLAGGKVRYFSCTAASNYQPDFDSLSEADWQQCQMLFICTPGNPSGAVMPIEQLQFLIKKAIQYNIVLISDECYSELYRDEQKPPVGLLEAASKMGHHSLKNCLVFHSLSKRSNLPGLRSGFVAGDSELISAFLKYRTYHGCAMPLPVQQVSVAAWQDETHVIENRKLYNEKYQAVVSELSSVLPLSIPEASFYLWPNLEQDDEKVAQRWLEKANIRVLPGQYLSRSVDGFNPGYGHVRIALVATLDECVAAAKRLKQIL